MDFRMRLVNGFIDSMSRAVVDDSLGKDMKSYSLDANIVISAVGMMDHGISETPESLASKICDVRSTVYMSTIVESIYAVENEFPDRHFSETVSDFGRRFVQFFDKDNVRIVSEDAKFESVADRISKYNPDAAGALTSLVPSMGRYDCNIMAQSLLEGNTVYTYDNLMVNQCKALGVDVVHGSVKPSSYKGTWSGSKFSGYGNLIIKKPRN